MKFLDFVSIVRERAAQGKHSDTEIIAKYGDNGKNRVVMEVKDLEWDEARQAFVVVVY